MVSNVELVNNVCQQITLVVIAIIFVNVFIHMYGIGKQILVTNVIQMNHMNIEYRIQFQDAVNLNKFL
jgi:hypothetical protein